MPRTSREVMAEALREIDGRFGRIESLLEDLKRILIDLADGQNEHRAHTRDQLDRLGTRVLTVEHRLGNGR
jgi:hypothetical protein